MSVKLGNRLDDLVESEGAQTLGQFVGPFFFFQAAARGEGGGKVTRKVLGAAEISDRRHGIESSLEA